MPSASWHLLVLVRRTLVYSHGFTVLRIALQRTLGLFFSCIIDISLCCPYTKAHANIFRIGYRPFLCSRSGGLSSRNNAIFSANPVDDRGKLQNALTLITPGWSLAPLRKFIESCHEFKRKNLHGTTTVYYAGGRADPYGDAWQSVSKAVRKLDTIDMDEDVKSDIIRDAEYYYSEES
jgi:hypothetical protein